MSIDSKTRRPGWGCSLALVGLLIGVVAAFALLGPRALAMLANQSTVAPAGLTDRTSPEQMVAQRAAAVAQLNGYGWVDQTANIAHIPIARAIALVAEQGLPVGVTPSAVATEQPAIDESAQTTPTTIDPTTVDFKRDVLPIFEERCSNCHGFEEPEEGLVLTGYRSVMQGSNNGPVIIPGDPDKSYLIEQIVTGKMPKRGKKLTSEEIALITAWVKGGARETAAEQTTGGESSAMPPPTAKPATAISTTATITTTPTPTVTIPVIDPATVSFQADVLPIFEGRCTDCHGFEEPEEGLVLTGYRSVMQGSNNGPVIIPGDPDKSYLIEQIVKGKMPKRGKKLTPEEIATIIAWVKGGALNQ